MIEAQKVDNWWECLQCRKQFEMDSMMMAYAVSDTGYYCEDCFKSGIIWAIAMAHKESNE